MIADRFTSVEDKTWFDDELLRLVEQELGPQMKKKAEANPVFVDFMRFVRFMDSSGGGVSSL